MALSETEHEFDRGASLECRAESACEYPSLDAEGNLIFRFGSPGKRYYLADQGVHAGDLLEMLLDDGAWQRVRFEWNPHEEEHPVLITDEDNAFRLDDMMRFRWPPVR